MVANFNDYREIAVALTDPGSPANKGRKLVLTHDYVDYPDASPSLAYPVIWDYFRIARDAGVIANQNPCCNQLVFLSNRRTQKNDALPNTEFCPNSSAQKGFM